jgi:hypothetical protein
VETKDVDAGFHYLSHVVVVNVGEPFEEVDVKRLQPAVQIDPQVFVNLREIEELVPVDIEMSNQVQARCNSPDQNSPKNPVLHG